MIWQKLMFLAFPLFVTFLENTMANAAETSITSLRLQDQS
uniref:Uncharacterized protein n=1 Tax=Citrobacter freundii TaxID=546 RepID=A0A2R4AKD8_CITFR|nr:hypothetical protein [Citrobacter freundii]